MKKFADRLFRLYSGHEKNSILTSIRHAFVFLVPVFMIGACALTLQHFPVTVVREFIANAGGGIIYEFLNIIYNSTYGFAAVYLVLALSHYEALPLNLHPDVRFFATITSTICYFAFLGPDVYSGRVALMNYTKMANVFSAMLIALAATHMFSGFYRLFNRHRSDRTSSFVRVLHSIFPTLACLLIFTVLSWLISCIPGICNFNDLIIYLLGRPFDSIGATYFGGLLIMLLESVLWLFGIHGGNVFDSLLTSETGAFAFGGGQIMTKSFIDTFALMGGCGTTVCLLLALILFSRDRKKKKLCRLAGIPLLFNINELLVFGIPVVLNPIYAIPFILTPLVSYSVAYLATAMGLVPQIVNASVQWTTPIIISGYQATGSVAGSLLQVVLLAIGVAIYAPFVLLDNLVAKENEARYIDHLTDVCRECEARGEAYHSDGERLAMRSFENDITAKLYSDIIHDRINLRYQPQVRNERIIAAEALLRFRFNEDGRYLYPPLVVGIACNADLFDPLSRAIVRRALADLRTLQTHDKDFSLAVNLRLDLIMDDAFRRWLVGEVKGAGVTPYTFGVEITEDAQLSDSVDCTAAFDELKRAEIEIMMDDFSMGHTSISILQKNYFNYIKIDGNLIKQLDNERSRSIVASIVKLGNELNFSVIAEYVETATQRDTLNDMGCHIFQGYLYYKDMPADELAALLDSQPAKQTKA